MVLDDFSLTDEELKTINKIMITACGSAYYAGSVGKYVIEDLCRIPVEADLASELRYRNPLVDEHTLLVVVSQSGETADTIAAMKECKARGARVLAIVNVVGSTIGQTGGRRALHLGRAGNCRGHHQGIHHPGGGVGSAGGVSGPPLGPAG